jgi:hypothetical protein
VGIRIGTVFNVFLKISSWSTWQDPKNFSVSRYSAQRLQEELGNSINSLKYVNIVRFKILKVRNFAIARNFVLIAKFRIDLTHFGGN